MGKVIVIANRKGGCGKSMTAASLGVGFARHGKKTLIINEKEIDPTAGIIHHKEGTDVMPSNNSLAGMELALAPLIGRETVLRQYIEKVHHSYDYCLIDTAPTLDLLTVNALTAAASVIIPVTPNYLDAKGLELLLKSIA